MKLQDDLKMTIIQNMCPDALRLHLGLNSSRLTTSDQMLAEIRANLESRQPQAMEIDSYEQQENHDIDSLGHKGKVKSKGRFSCGGNHLARNCDTGWQEGKGKGP